MWFNEVLFFKLASIANPAQRMYIQEERFQLTLPLTSCKSIVVFFIIPRLRVKMSTHFINTKPFSFIARMNGTLTKANLAHL